MPRHAFRFPSRVREAVRRHVDNAVSRVHPDRYKQEPAYCAALAQALEGVAYEGPEGKVEFSSTVMSDRGRGAAEGWSGTDFAITADIGQGADRVRKAILIQAKRGALDELGRAEAARLNKQIDDMSELTRSPKIMDIQADGDRGNPGIYSGRVYRRGDDPRRYSLADYMVMRVLPTLDGDTRPDFVAAVQDSDLPALAVKARLRERDGLRRRRPKMRPV